MAITIEQLKAALERRGYTVRIRPRAEDEAQVTFAIYRNAGPLTPETQTVVRTLSLHDLAVTSMGAGEMAEELLTPFSENQRHMVCAQCKEPLLQAVAGSGKGEGATHWYVYRSAKAGPNSPELRECPACHGRLSEETVKEIEDL